MSEMLTYSPEAWMYPKLNGVIERWLPARSFEGQYEVSDKGRVRSLNYNKTRGLIKFISKNINKGGYHVVALRKKGKGYLPTVHKLVMGAFVGSRPEEMEVNHIDGNKLNNRLENLEYVTRSENCKHSFVMGLQCNKGVRHSQARLNDEKVIEIRKLCGDGLTRKEVAEMFGVTAGQITNIMCGRGWKHVKSLEVN